MIAIKEFNTFYQTQVVEHILDIENNEFNMALTLEMQPDLADINGMYQKRNGNFWVALYNNTVIGSIGIYPLTDTNVELRRMFVKPQYRGREYGVGQKMLDTALNWTKANGYKEVFLETTDWLVAASKFYANNNFGLISKKQLPDNFPVLRSSGKFMSLKLQ